MPCALRLHLEGSVPDRPFRHADGLRARVYDWYRAVVPETAGAIHSANAPKPFTIGPLVTLDPSAAPGDRAPHGFDIALLADGLIDPLVKAIAAEGRRMRLGTAHFAIRRVEPDALATWAELLTPPEAPVRSLALRFLTPMAHHAPGPLRKAVPLPVPEMCFGNWMRRWNAARAHCGSDGPPETPAAVSEVAAERIAVSRFEGATQDAWLGDSRRFIGFVGAAVFAVLQPNDLSREVHTWLAALARFSSYCGTGVETMRGMGQTEFLSDVG